MVGRGKLRTKYTTPRKGTKVRKAVLLLLRPCGATMQQMITETSICKASNILEDIKNFYGFDVQIINQIPSKIGRHTNVYRIIGRWRWNGSYRSFL